MKQTLTKVIARDNFISDIGLEHLALGLERNRVTDFSLHDPSLLLCMQTLTTLDLACNRIETSNRQYLIDIFQKNRVSLIISFVFA